MTENKKITYSGILILEGGVKFRFVETFDCVEDVDDWLVSLSNFELPIDDLISAREENSAEIFIIPTAKILAYKIKT